MNSHLLSHFHSRQQVPVSRPSAPVLDSPTPALAMQKHPDVSEKPLLEVYELSKSYGGRTILHDVHFSLFPQKIYALMGPSGSGKTTLLRILLGLEKADGGEIRWNGIPADNPVDTSRLRISAVFQEDRLCESFSPLENVQMALPKKLPSATLRQEMSRLLPEESLSRPVSTLSGGMKRRTAILRALLYPSDFLILDEPFTGLDEGTKETVIHYILEKCENRLILFTTHQMEDVSLMSAELLSLQDFRQ